MLNNHGLNV